MKKFFLNSLFITLFIFVPLALGAQDNSGNAPAQGRPSGLTYECQHPNPNPPPDTLWGECNFNDLVAATMYLVNWGTGFALSFSVFVIAYAGWNFMISGDNASKRTDAKNMLIKVVIGIALIVGAWLIVRFIVVGLGVNTGLSNITSP